MKHIKHHPLINDSKQKLSKDMKKQELVRPKKDKKLDADDSLSDIKVSKRYTKPSNKKLSSENHLAAGKGKVKKVTEELFMGGRGPTEYAELCSKIKNGLYAEAERMYYELSEGDQTSDMDLNANVVDAFWNSPCVKRKL